MRIVIALAVAIVALPVVAQAEQKDKAVVQDMKTGQQYEVKVPKDTIKDVQQTGPNSYNVQVNRDAAKKIEVNPVPQKK